MSCGELSFHDFPNQDQTASFFEDKIARYSSTSLTMMLYPLLVLTAALLTDSVVSRDLQSPINTDVGVANTIRDTLKDNEIIGDVLDDFEPSYALDIVYPKHHEVVSLGNDIPVKHVQHRPTFTFRSINPAALSTNKTFIIALTDPDAKSRMNPKWSEMCHWLINITKISVDGPRGNAYALKQTGELKGYKPPGPPPKTGPHRYVFVLLEGDKDAAASEPKDRQHWGYGKPRHGVRDWAKENNLNIVGANFFFAENEKQ
ncbi:Carboxypeptidase Y inhibitor [Cyphellophora attinorum]|uniref:Carboxypeptidase Y inhibitor n=1 Tax=Cyphellophora attinorum TaxID=1664694 RepID=A0A0N1P372_9EURO|nr:Carboxypeptidase Y inhibitor [Phialophora attinorum]KPI43557.1 Carboxypeptidase Y inhibitor [Phialophora attinorum]